MGAFRQGGGTLAQGSSRNGEGGHDGGRCGAAGLKDQPIKDRDEEALGLGEYAEVLTEFIRRCDTPLTVALQGGLWVWQDQPHDVDQERSQRGRPLSHGVVNTWHFFVGCAGCNLCIADPSDHPRYR